MISRLFLSLLFVAANATAAITLVQKAQCSMVAISSDTGISCSFASPPTAGNAALVSFMAPTTTGGLSFSGVTDNQSNSYSALATVTGDVPQALTYGAFAVSSSGTFTVTAAFTTAGGTQVSIVLAEYSGLTGSLNTSSTSNSTSGGQSTIACSGVTTSAGTALVYVYGAVWSGAGVISTASSGFTLEQTNGAPNANTAGFSDAVKSAGTYTPSFTLSGGTSSQTTCVIVALTGVSAGGKLLKTIN